MRILGSSGASSPSLQAAFPGDEVTLKGTGIVRVLKIESIENKMYLVKNVKTLELSLVSINQLTKES